MEKKTGLKFNIQKPEIMASSPITSWQREGEKVEAVTGFIFLGSKITADGDCSHEIKRCLMFGRETMISIDTVLKECNPYQATNSILHRARTNNFTICMEKQKTSNSQSDLQKEEWNWRNQPT